MTEKPKNQFEIDIRVAEARVNRCQKALDEAITSTVAAQNCVYLTEAQAILIEKQRGYILNLKAEAPRIWSSYDGGHQHTWESEELNDGWQDRSIESLWSLFGDEPLDDNECLENNFLDFPSGTEKEEIWHWFDEQHSKGVAYLLNPAQWEMEMKEAKSKPKRRFTDSLLDDMFGEGHPDDYGDK